MHINISSGWILIEAAIIALAIYLRCRVGFKKKIGQDTWFHLLIADIIRRKKRLPDKTEYFIYDGPYGYPPLLHILLARIPANVAERFAWLFSAIVEAIQILFLFFFSLYVTEEPSVAVLASFVYAISPIIIGETHSLNTRPLGSLIFTLTMVPIILYPIYNNLYFAMVGVFFGIILLHTHKLATQALFFTLIGFAIIERNPVYLLLEGCIFGGAIILPGGWYRKKIVPEHIAILDFWRRHIKDDYYSREEHLDNGENRDDKSLILLLLTILKKLISKGYWMFFVIFSLLFFGFDLSVIEIKLLESMLIIFSCFIVFDYVPFLKFLGEGHRYLECGVFPTAFLAASIVVRSFRNIFVDALFLFCILFSVIIIYLSRGGGAYDRIALNTAIKEIYNYVKEAKKEGVMCIPYNLSYMTAYFTRKKVFFVDNALTYEKAYTEALFGSPADKPLRALIDKYGISYVIVDKVYFDLSCLDLGTVTEIMERDKYCLLEVVR
jgi:hypothetical protein